MMETFRFGGALLLSLLMLAGLSPVTIDGRKISPKETCDDTPSTGNCFAPDCFCSHAMKHPNSANLALTDVPQMVYLTFDGGINVLNYPMFQDIFNGTRLNPNGAPISATFFVTHEYTSYSFMHQLYRHGHELALGSISHKYDSSYWKNLDVAGWKAEVGDQKGQMAYFAKVPVDEIIGMRAPLLQGGGDNMYQAAYESEIFYESSRPTWALRPDLWPYTADYDSIQDCPTAPCYNSSFPGFFVSPLVDLLGNNTSPCSFVDACLEEPQSEQDLYDLLMRNFLEHLDGNRSPIGFYLHAGWLLNDEKPFLLPGYKRFLDDILKIDSVYIVSIKKALGWMRDPQPLSNIDAVEGFPPAPTPEDGCRFVFDCIFTGDQLPPGMTGERRMSSCQSCPSKYPWVGNPLGLS